MNTGVARNLSWGGGALFLGGDTPDPLMATISLPSKVVHGQKKNKENSHFFVKNVFLGIFGEAIAPICPSLATPMNVNTLCNAIHVSVKMYTVACCTQSIIYNDVTSSE